MRRTAGILILTAALAAVPVAAAADQGSTPSWRACGSAGFTDPSGLRKAIAWSVRGITCARGRSIVLTARRRIGAGTATVTRVAGFRCVVVRGEAIATYTCRNGALGARGTVGG